MKGDMFDEHFVCYGDYCCGTEQSIHHIYTNFPNQKLQATKDFKNVPGDFKNAVFLLVKSHLGKKLSHSSGDPKDCCESENICNVSTTKNS